MATGWLWCRFRADPDDWRPVTWPPPGPYWCSGYGETYSVIIAYVRPGMDVRDWWPEAEDVDVTEVDELKFSSRFPKPDWWNEETGEANDQR